MKAMMAVVASIAIVPAASSAVTSSREPNAVSTELIRTAATISGQPLRLPQGNAEMVAYRVEIPADGRTTIHQHPWSRFVYVERGPLTITNQDTGQVHRFKTGDVFAEVIAQWHQGHAPGAEGARLLITDLVPPGVTNMKMR